MQKVCKELRRLKANKAHEIASRTEKGDWGLSEKEESDYQDQENEILGKFERLFTDVNHLSSQFRIEKKSFLDLLREYSEHYSSYAQLHFLLQ